MGGSKLAFKYYTWVKVRDSDKRSSLHHRGSNKDRKKFYITGPMIIQSKYLMKHYTNFANYVIILQIYNV